MLDVIIPAYNSHKTIEKTLLSIIYQEKKDKINVYIVNDGSTNDYQFFVKKYKDILKIKELKNKKNMGPGYARQYGIDHSNSEYIMFIDSDDCFASPFSISILLDNIMKSNADIVMSDFLEEIKDDFKRYEKSSVWLHGKIYKRSFLEKENIKFFNNYSNEDNAFNQLLFLSDAVIGYVPTITYIWKYNINSITRKNDYEYKFNGLEGYFDNMLKVAVEAKKRNYNDAKIAYFVYSVLISSYYYYLQFGNFEKYSKLLERTKEIFKFYKDLNYILNYDEECGCMKSQMDKILQTDEYSNVLFPKITFVEYINKLEEL